MAIYICPDCRARNTSAGRCIMCRRSLGSPRAAVLAATAAAAGMGLLWAGSALALGIQIPVYAAFFGAVVSGVMVHVSGGRGFLYQAIASAFTLAGIFASDGFVVWWLVRAQGIAPSLRGLVTYLVNQDGITLACGLLGLMGGFWVWKEGDAGA